MNTIDLNLVTASIDFKPWKGKLNHVVFVHDLSQDIEEAAVEIMKEWKRNGQYKRRIVEGVTITYPIKYKL